MINRSFQPDPEYPYILDCLSALLDGQVFPRVSAGLNWDPLLADLARHRLVGLFAAHVQRSQVAWPAAFTERLRRERILALLNGNAFAEDLSRILAALRAAGLAVIVLKGWALIPTLYHNDPSQRTFSDADLLIPLAAADQGERVLRDQGYDACDETWPGFCRRYDIHLHLSKSQPVSPIHQRFPNELHWGLMHIPFLNQRIDLAGLFQRAVPLQIQGQAAFALAPEDHLVYTCAHLLHHRQAFVLSRWFELACWLRQHEGQLDWQAVLERAQQWRLGMGIQYAFTTLETLWPGILPAGIFDKVRSLRAGFIERAIHHLEETGSPVLRTLVVLATLPFTKKVGYLFQSLFPNPHYLHKRYGPAPMGFWPLLYFQRAGRVWGYVVRLLARRKPIA